VVNWRYSSGGKVKPLPLLLNGGLWRRKGFMAGYIRSVWATGSVEEHCQPLGGVMQVKKLGDGGVGGAPQPFT
jgi:hypothetical protein